MLISENETIILKTRIGLQSKGPVKNYIFKTKKMGEIDFSLFLNKEYYVWYELIDDVLVVYEETVDQTDKSEKHEKTAAKYNLKKINKKRKLLMALPIMPLTLFEFYEHKCSSKLDFMRLPEYSYILINIQAGEKVFLIDSKKKMIKYGLEYKGGVELVDGMNCFDNIVIIGGDNVIDIIESKYKLCDKFIIYVRSILTATNLFCYFLQNKNFIDVNMVDFFKREFQTNENVHPMVRGNIESGFVITGRIVHD